MFNEWHLKQDQVDAEEERLRARVRALQEADRRDFYRALQPHLKDPDTYAVLNWFFLAGLHHFYLRRWARGLINLAVFLTGLALLFSPWFALGLGLMVLILLVELWALFRAQLIVQDWNNALYRRLLQRYPGR